MSHFDELRGLDLPKQHLAAMLENQRLPSAFAFLGKKGLGKSSAALCLAKEIAARIPNESRRRDNLMLLEKGNHPDFIVVKKNPHIIRIDQIKEIAETLTRAPALSTTRVIVIESAESMKAEAANAFLKTLEEPPPNNLFILTLPEQGLLPETVISRCEKIYFPQLQKEHLEPVYREKFGVAEELLPFLLAHSRGAIRKNWLNHLEEIRGVRLKTLEMVTDLKSRSMIYHFNELGKIAAEGFHGEFLEFLTLWFRDALLILHRAKVRHVNADRIADLEKFAADWEAKALLQCLEAITETEYAFTLHMAKQTALEGLLLTLRKIKNGGFVY